MFKDDFIACIKVGQKVLREYGGVVLVPFGTEYSIFLKNMKSERAVVKIFIDGEDVLNDGQLIVDSHSETNLERFLETMDKGHKFKFIEKTQQVSNYRGDKPEDGLIRIEYQFEKPITNLWNTFPYGISNGYCNYSSSAPDALLRGSITTSCANITTKNAVNDAGITGHGSISEQQFHTANVKALDPTVHTIILNLKGQLAEQKIVEAVTVQNKITCHLCGTKNRSDSKFCGECGNCLVNI